jgi:arylamine N-acetyltransferase
MQTAIKIFLDQLKQQGFSVLLLVAAIWWMNGQNSKLSNKVDICNANTIEIYKEQNIELRKVVQQNTVAFENFSFLIEQQLQNK